MLWTILIILAIVALVLFILAAFVEAGASERRWARYSHQKMAVGRTLVPPWRSLPQRRQRRK